MKPALIARAQRFLIATALLSVILAIFAYRTSTEHVESVASTLSAATFLEKVDELFSAVQDAETGQRGYLLTGRLDYLTTFLTAREQLPRRLVAIDQVAAENGVPNSQMKRLHALVREKFDELEKTIGLERLGQHAEAITEVETDRGHRIMEEIRALVEAMKENQQQLFQSRLEKQRQRQKLLNIVLISAIAVALLFLFLAYQLSNRFAKERETVEREIRKLNASLESRVRERTAELEESTRELARRSTELEQSNNDLSQFAYVASHDLQEPLRMVGSYMGLLEKRYGERLDEKAKTYIQFAIDGAARMQTLISDLLQYSRAGTQRVVKQTVSSEELVRTALKNLEVTIAESHAEIVCGTLPTVEADPTKVIQIFQNLIGNAIKFHKPGCPPVIKIGAELTENEWRFSVADNGIGFDTAYQERIYEIFQRLNSSGTYAGNGIGLAICRRMIEQHGGRLWAESKLDVGSVFYFALPSK